MNDIIGVLNKRDTEVRLLNVPLESDYRITLYFDTREEQTVYFLSHTKLTGYEYSYQRKDNCIRYPLHIDKLWNCNYVMYRNSAYSNKWFYAFIKELEYVNDGTTNIYIETDVFQTWLINHDYVVQPSFVEREHVIDDAIGKHTFPEGLETGDYICLNHDTVDELKDLILVVGVTANPDGTFVGGKNYNGIYSGIQYKYCSATRPELMTEFIQSYASSDKVTTEAIQCLFLAPDMFATADDGASPLNKICTMGYDVFADTIFDGASRDMAFLSDSESINDEKFIPHNNKLFCYPYQYMIASNNAGSSAIYKYEFFNGDARFKIEGAITPGCSVRLIPTNYKNDNNMQEEGINLGKFPICNWQTDVYTNWLTQNSVNIATSVGMGAVSMVAGVLMRDGGAFTSGLNQTLGVVGEMYSKSMTPPQSHGNINCGDVITASANNTFHFYQMSIRTEYARIVDNFFDMYGYKICRVKTPNVNHRKRFWYTKTIDVNIDSGNIPMNDMIKIKNCFNNGITFWKDIESLGNYSKPNEIK